jgi:hypothetical protein
MEEAELSIVECSGFARERSHYLIGHVVQDWLHGVFLLGVMIKETDDNHSTHTTSAASSLKQFAFIFQMI